MKTPPKVKRADLIAHFDGSVVKVAAHFNINRAAVYLWGEFIPDYRALQIENEFPHLVCKESNAA